MFSEFQPLFRNPHLATIAGNFWSRKLDLQRYPEQVCNYTLSPETTLQSIQQQPLGAARAQVVCLHGLEGSAQAGYLRSLASSLLQAGYGVHRTNLRTCGGTESLCRTMYHSGLTDDTWEFVQILKQQFQQPVFLAGFSLGGNVALKLAGERDVTGYLDAVCSVSAPIDLAACVHEIDRRQNILYARRFLDRLKGRIRRKSALAPDTYSSEGLETVRSIWEFDDRFTAPLFGFGTAQNYYQTQSAQNFTPSIRIPALLITAQDDPLVPYRLYQQAAVTQNPNLTVLAPRFGGHLGFLSRHKPRFWLDSAVVQWFDSLLETQNKGTSKFQLTSS